MSLLEELTAKVMRKTSKQLLDEAVVTPINLDAFEQLLYSFAIELIKGSAAAEIKALAKQHIAKGVFWAESFGRAYRGYERFLQDPSRDDYIDSVGEALDEIQLNIYEYYIDEYGHKPSGLDIPAMHPDPKIQKMLQKKIDKKVKIELKQPEDVNADDVNAALSKDPAFSAQFKFAKIAEKEL